jgi:hypothetical protein
VVGVEFHVAVELRFFSNNYLDQPALHDVELSNLGALLHYSVVRWHRLEIHFTCQSHPVRELETLELIHLVDQRESLLFWEIGT